MPLNAPRRIDAEATAARAAANVSSAEALIAHLKLAIEKMRRELYGSRSERGRKLLDQMELELEDLESAAAEDEIAAEMATAKANGTPGSRARAPQAGAQAIPPHLPRERVIVPGPTACACCGSTRLSTLEVIPRQWKVIQHVRQKFTCRHARRSAKRRRPSMSSPAAARGRAFWP